MCLRHPPVLAFAAALLAHISTAAADTTVDRGYSNSGNVYHALPRAAPDALSDLPTAPKPPQPAARVPPHTPEFANPRNASPSADGTKWDFQKDSSFVLSDGTKRPKGPALRAR